MKVPYLIKILPLFYHILPKTKCDLEARRVAVQRRAFGGFRSCGKVRHGGVSMFSKQVWLFEETLGYQCSKFQEIERNWETVINRCIYIYSKIIYPGPWMSFSYWLINTSILKEQPLMDNREVNESQWAIKPALFSLKTASWNHLQYLHLRALKISKKRGTTSAHYLV